MHRLWWVMLVGGCAAGEGTPSQPPCGSNGPCPRGQVCVFDRCRSAVDLGAGPDLGQLDAARSADAEPADAALDASVVDAAAAGDVGPVDAAADLGAEDAASTPDGGGMCEPGAVEDCGRNVGLCRAGRQICGADGRWGPCEGGVEPREDTCNGADDDCNGVVDDGFGVGEPCDGVGACGVGVVECRNTVLTRCSTEPGGSADGSAAEICDAADDDCDGRVDEELGVGDVCVGACGEGVQECAADGAVRCSTDEGGSGYVARDERCDGRDDDCDGAVDEDFRLGQPCNGQGLCGMGVRECGAEGQGICSTEAGGSASEAAPERCDGRDEDCDGAVDETFAIGDPCVSPGACGPGIRECGGGEARCSTAPGGSADAARPERCNQRDDDCDGVIDEGFEPGPEACNGEDDDCDGVIDEGAACGGDTCATAPPLPLRGVVSGDTAELADDYGRSTCTAQSPGRDQVYRVSFPAAGEYVVGVAPLVANYDLLFWLGTSCEDVTTCVSPSAGRNRYGAGRPEVRRIVMPRAGDFFLVTDSPFDQAGGAFVAGVAPAEAGERCGTAVALPVPGRFVGTTEGRANDVFRDRCPAGSPSGGADQIFRIELEAPRDLRIRVTPSDDADPIIQVVADCNGADCAGGVDDQGRGGQEILDLRLEAGTWYLVVDHQGSPGGFLLEVLER